MYEKFKGELVNVGLDCHILHGTLVEEKSDSLKLLIVNPDFGTMEEAIINIKKVNYVISRVDKITKSKKANSF